MSKEFHRVSEAVLREIERKRKLLGLNPLSNRYTSYLDGESVKRSVSLEIDGYEANDGKSLREKAKEKKACEQFLEEAVEWGTKNYRAYLSLEYLRELGTRVDPRPKKNGLKKNQEGFRGDRDFVQVTGAQNSTTTPQMLERELLFFGFDNFLITSPVEKATHAHFHLARIHPYNDGNGRTARATMNIILKHEGYPPTIIGLEEITEYSTLIDNAVGAYTKRTQSAPSILKTKYEQIIDALKEDPSSTLIHPYFVSAAQEIARYRMSREQNEFYDFIALKIRDSLNETLKSRDEERRTKLSKKLLKRLFGKI